MERIDTTSTALIVIDLQKGIVQMPTQPHSPQTIIKNCVQLVDLCREQKVPVFLVHVNPTDDDRLKVSTDASLGSHGKFPSDWAEFIPDLKQQSSDIIITKKQWGAFYGTELDLQLRRRKIDTLIVCGIATNYGVESTARFAYEFGYNQLFAEDAMGSLSPEAHQASVEYALKRMGRVRSTTEISTALK